MALPGKLLALPFFLYALFIFYWSMAIGCLSYRIKFASFVGRRRDMHDWTTTMKAALGWRVLKLGERSLYKGGKCVYLANHRSWADFFVDIYLTEGLGAPMSRALVFFAFPVFMSSAVVLKGIILFKRGSIADKQKFNTWLDEKLGSSYISSLLVYPEGHRSTRPVSLPVKRGMLYYAHSRSLPTQIIITRGKEDIMSEKRSRAAFGVTLVTSYSEPIQSKGKDFEAFSAEVMNVWDAQWKEVYSADATGLPELRQDDLPSFEYTMGIRVNQFLCCVAGISALLFALRLTLLGAAATLALLPAALQVPLVVAVASLFGASFLANNHTGRVFKGLKAA